MGGGGGWWGRVDEDWCSRVSNLEHHCSASSKTLKPPRVEGKMWVCVFYYAP